MLEGQEIAAFGENKGKTVNKDAVSGRSGAGPGSSLIVLCVLKGQEPRAAALQMGRDRC